MTVEAHHIDLFPSLLPLHLSKRTAMDANTGFYHDGSNDAVDLSLTKKRRREVASETFIQDDFSEKMMQQQFEIDRLIFLHMERVKAEIKEHSKIQLNRTIRAIELPIRIKLREKDEYIAKISNLNATLQDRVKSLFLENQLWRDLAQSNEATANALRANLEQVLVQVNNKSTEDDDAESCCGSSGPTSTSEKRMCRRCGGRESGVLVLPCRHLCLCTVCGPTVHICPICKGNKNASVHVNFS